MKYIIRLSLLLFASSVLSASAAKEAENLIENGDFPSETIGAWRLNVGKHHGVDPKPYVKDGVFGLKVLEPTSGPYLTFGQPVHIEEGKKYRLTFDVRADECKSKIGMRVGTAKPSSIGLTNHLKVQMISATEEWVTHTFEFTGMYETDSKFVKEWRKHYRKNSIKKPEKRMQTDKKKYSSGKGPSALTFILGKLKGKNLEFRKVSIVEVTE